MIAVCVSSCEREHVAGLSHQDNQAGCPGPQTASLMKFSKAITLAAWLPKTNLEPARGFREGHFPKRGNPCSGSIWFGPDEVVVDALSGLLGRVVGRQLPEGAFQLPLRLTWSMAQRSAEETRKSRGFSVDRQTLAHQK